MTLADLGPGYHLVPTSAHAGVRRRGRCSWGERPASRAYAGYLASRYDPMAVQLKTILRGVLADIRED